MTVQFQPMLDRILVKLDPGKETTEGGLIIPEQYRERVNEGTAVAVGQGKELRDGSLRKLLVNVGDYVIFEAHSAVKLNIDGNVYYSMREDQVMGVVAKS